MAKKTKKTSKGKSAPKQPKTKDHADAYREGLQLLPPLERIATVKPFWESLSQEQRQALLVFPLDGLTAFAKVQAERQKKEAALDAAECLQTGRFPFHSDPPVDEVLEEALERSRAKGTWKVWQWRTADKEFYDSESFRKYMEEELLDETLRKYLPREEEGAKVPENPAEHAFRTRMQNLITKINEIRTQHEETQQQQQRRLTHTSRQRGNNNNNNNAAAELQMTAPYRDINVEQINLILSTLEKEHEALYHMILRPITSFVCELLPEASRLSTRLELSYEDFDSMAPEDVSRVAEWVIEKVDSLTTKLKPEAKELEVEDDEEPIGDVDLFSFVDGGDAMTVNSKWLGHLQTRLLGEDGQPRKSNAKEDPTEMGLVLEWAYGTIVSTAEKARESASRQLGSLQPSAEQGFEQLRTTLQDQAQWEMRAKIARELMAEMLASRKEHGELKSKYNISKPKPKAPPTTTTTATATPLAITDSTTTDTPTPTPTSVDDDPQQPQQQQQQAPSDDIPPSAILSVLKREQLLTRAKLQFLQFEQLAADKKLRALKAQLRQLEPELDRLKRELDEVRNAPRGLEGTYKTAEEMERHRQRLADVAIEEQIDVQAAVREHNTRISRCKDARDQLKREMAQREAEIAQLTSWRSNILNNIKQLEDLVALAAAAADTTSTGMVIELQSTATLGDTPIDEKPVKDVLQERLDNFKAKFLKDLRDQLYTEADDVSFFDKIKKQLKEIDRRIEDGRVALQHLEQYFINVACDDPGAAVGVHIILPYLTEVLDAKALDYAALKASEAENEVIQMEAERAEKDKAEKEKKNKAKQKAKEKVRAEKEKERMEKEAVEKEGLLKAEEERKKKEEEQEELRRKREAEKEEQRRQEEELMEKRRQELLSDENSYWRMRQEQEDLIAAEKQIEEQLRKQAAGLSDSANEADGFTTASAVWKKKEKSNNKSTSSSSSTTAQKQQQTGGLNDGSKSGNNNNSRRNGGGNNDGSSKQEAGKAGGATVAVKVVPKTPAAINVKPVAVKKTTTSNSTDNSNKAAAVTPTTAAAPVATTSNTVSEANAATSSTTAPQTTTAAAGAHHHQRQPSSPASTSSLPPPPPPTPSLPSGSQSPVKLPAPSTPDRNAGPQPPHSFTSTTASAAQQQQLPLPPPPTLAALPVTTSTTSTTAAVAGVVGPVATGVPQHGVPVPPNMMPPPPHIARRVASPTEGGEGATTTGYLPPGVVPPPPPPPGHRSSPLPPHQNPAHGHPVGVPPGPGGPPYPHPHHQHQHPGYVHGHPAHMPAPPHNQQPQPNGPSPSQQQQQQGPPHGSMPPHPPPPGMMYYPGPMGPPPPHQQQHSQQQGGGPNNNNNQPPPVPPPQYGGGGVTVGVPNGMPLPPGMLPYPPHMGMPPPHPGLPPHVHMGMPAHAQPHGGHHPHHHHPQHAAQHHHHQQQQQYNNNASGQSRSSSSLSSYSSGGGSGIGGSNSMSSRAKSLSIAAQPFVPSTFLRSPSPPVLPTTSTTDTNTLAAAAPASTSDNADAGGKATDGTNVSGGVVVGNTTASATTTGVAGTTVVVPAAINSTTSSITSPRGILEGSDPGSGGTRSSGTTVGGTAGDVQSSTSTSSTSSSSHQDDGHNNQQQQTAAAVAVPVKQLKDLKFVRGMTNAPGLYNCFINVIVQTLWHLPSFRTALLALSPDTLAKKGSPEDVAVLQALRNVFNQLQQPNNDNGDGDGSSGSGSSSRNAAVSASELRRALGALRSGTSSNGSSNGGSRFQLDDMHDASEALEEIFECLHRAQVGNGGSGGNSNNNNSGSKPATPSKTTSTTGTGSNSSSSVGVAHGFIQPKRVTVPLSEARGWAAAPHLPPPSPPSTTQTSVMDTTTTTTTGVNGVDSTVSGSGGSSPSAAAGGAGAGAKDKPASVWSNGVALAKVKQAPGGGGNRDVNVVRSVVQQVFGLEVQVPLTESKVDRSSPKKQAPKTSIEALQYSKYFHLLHASALRAAAVNPNLSSFEQRLIAAETQEGEGQGGGPSITITTTSSSSPLNTTTNKHHSNNTKNNNTNSTTTTQKKSVLLPMTRLLTNPKAVTFGIVWDTPQASSEVLLSFMAALSTTLDITKAFATIPQNNSGSTNSNGNSGSSNSKSMYELRGLVCYSRSHYKAFALNSDVGGWLLFDDAKVSFVGGWQDVVVRVGGEQLQPSVLFYEVVA